MKQQDLIIIIVVSFISAIFSFLVSRSTFSSSEQLTQQVEVVEEISSDFSQIDQRFFNDQSINPTKNITIGDPNNPNP